MDNEARNSSKTPNPAFPVCCLSFMASWWLAFGIFFLFPGIYFVIYEKAKPELGILCILMSLLPIIIGCIMFYCVRIECCEKPFFPKNRINEVHLPQQPNISVHIHQQPENQGNIIQILPYQNPSNLSGQNSNQSQRNPVPQMLCLHLGQNLSTSTQQQANPNPGSDFHPTAPYNFDYDKIKDGSPPPIYSKAISPIYPTLPPINTHM